MARQLGSAIGVAVLVALLDDSVGGDLLAGLRRGWWFCLAAGLGSAAVAAALRPARAKAPVRSAELAVERSPA